MKKINVDQLIAIVGKEKLSPYFLNKDWIRSKRFKIKRKTRDDILYGNISDKEIAINLAFYFYSKDDGEGNFSGKIDLRYFGIKDLKKELPEQIKTLDGDFNITGNTLENLVGGPEIKVTGDYYAPTCGLKSLKGAPETVDKFFNVSDNNLESLAYAPKSMGTGIFDSNKIKNFDLCSIEKIQGTFKIGKNELDSVDGIEKIKIGMFCYRGNPIFAEHTEKGLTIETFNDIPKVVKTQ